MVDIYSVVFVYKCKLCGGFSHRGPYYCTSESNLLEHVPLAVIEVIDSNIPSMFEIADREGYFIDPTKTRISFHRLLQYSNSPNKISKYDWHDCSFSSNLSNCIYDGSSGLMELSGFKSSFAIPGNPRNDNFLRHLIASSRKCRTKEELFELLAAERSEMR